MTPRALVGYLTSSTGRLALVSILSLACYLEPVAAQTHPSAGLSGNVAIDIIPVQGRVHMIVVGGVDGVNLTAQVGDEGIFLVDAGPKALTAAIIQAIELHFDKPIQYLINTSLDADHTGGNAAMATAVGRDNPAIHFLRVRPEDQGLRIISGLKTQQRMAGAFLKEDEVDPDSWPLSAFTERKEMYFNGEPIILTHVPSAHTDGDIMVFFRGSNVISTGDVFVMGNYPVIDLKRGGGIQGLIDGAIFLEDLAIAEYNTYGGTRIIPGHGGLSTENEIIDYLFMLSIVRDRVQELVKKGASLDQVKAARPTMDYDAAWGGRKTFWTGDMFLEAVYRDLSKNGKAKSPVTTQTSTPR